jgi:NTE family protein
MKKIAIACQGGGSHTAFTAGVLISLLKHDAHRKNDVVGLSGTSGGAICAALAWNDILRNTRDAGRELESFWMDNATENMVEWMYNSYMMTWEEYVEKGFLPEIKLSPYNVWLNLMQSATKAFFPKFHHFFDLKGLINSHINFDELERIKKEKYQDMKDRKSVV